MSTITQTRKMDVPVLLAVSALLTWHVYSAQPSYRAGNNFDTQCAESARSKDESSCLEALRKRAEDPSVFWFGNTYNALCGSREKYLADCYLQHTARGNSLLGRLFANLTLDPHSLDRYLEVTYTSRPGSYTACENKYVHNETRKMSLDPMAPVVMTPFEVREAPKVTWRADDKEKLYTLVFYDVGYMALQALYVNIPGNSFSRGQTIVEYSGPLNPTRNDNPYVFILYRQPGSISVHQTEKKLLTVPIQDRTGRELENLVQKHRLQGPVAMNWVTVTGDAYAAEAQRQHGFMNTCAFLVADAFQQEDFEFLPEETSAKVSHVMNVYVNVTYEATSISITSCCTRHTYPSRTFNLNPLGDEKVLPAHSRTDVTKFVTLHMTTVFPDTQRDFKGKTLTLVMADPDVPFPAFGTPKLPFLHWLVINIRGGDVASGHVVQDYMGPAPPDPNFHRYYILLYEQPRDLDPDKMDYSSPNCSNFQGRCLMDVSRMVTDNGLTLIGATWMLVRTDAFVRQFYVASGLQSASVECHGVPGYADPCPASTSGRDASLGVSRVVVGLLVCVWSVRTYLL